MCVSDLHTARVVVGGAKDLSFGINWLCGIPELS